MAGEQGHSLLTLLLPFLARSRAGGGGGGAVGCDDGATSVGEAAALAVAGALGDAVMASAQQQADSLGLAPEKSMCDGTDGHDAYMDTAAAAGDAKQIDEVDAAMVAAEEDEEEAEALRDEEVLVDFITVLNNGVYLNVYQGGSAGPDGSNVGEVGDSAEDERAREAKTTSTAATTTAGRGGGGDYESEGRPRLRVVTLSSDRWRLLWSGVGSRSGGAGGLTRSASGSIEVDEPQGTGSVVGPTSVT